MTRRPRTPESHATSKGKHTLKFVKRGQEVVPDPETASIIRQYGWASEP